MSFGFGVGDFIAVLQLANDIRDRLTKAPEQFKATSQSVASLSSILEKVKLSATQDDLAEDWKKSLASGVQECNDALSKLKDSLDRHEVLREDDPAAKKDWRSKFNIKKTVRKVTWDPKEINELQGRIDSTLQRLNLVYNQITKAHLEEMRKREQARDDEKRRQDDERKRQNILDWLDTAKLTDKHSKQQRDFLEDFCEGTGQWLLTSPKFKDWLAGEDRILLCCGDPGAGKTMLATRVINWLLDPSSAGGNGVAFFYCNFRQQQEQRRVDILTCLLHRLLSKAPKLLSENIQDVYERHQANKTNPSSTELSQLLQATVRDYPKVFIVIDALDEVQDDLRDDFISELLKLRANILITSRPIPKVRQAFVGHQRTVELDIRARDEDIQRYLDGCKLDDCLSSKPDLQKEVKDGVFNASDGIFLVARLYMATLRECFTVQKVKAELSKVNDRKGSSAYNTAYEIAMERINGMPESRRLLARMALAWMTYALRPLTPLEFRYALAVEVGDDATEDATDVAEEFAANEATFDEDNLSSIDHILAVCAGLITVDKERNVVRFVHYTTQEYFERTLEQQWFPGGHKRVAAACITYLSAVSCGVCDSSEELKARIKKDPLYGYAGRYWGDHVRGSSMETSKIVWGFFRDHARLAEAVQPFFLAQGNDIYVDGITPLHVAALHRLSEVVIILVQQHGIDVGCKDVRGRTPLHFAAEYGRDAALGELLTLGADPNLQDEKGYTPLLLAATHNHEGVVKQLLASGANPNLQNEYGNAPLLWAATDNHEGVVKQLLASGADPNLQNKYGNAPLLWAANHNHEGVVKQLLASGADPNLQDKYGDTPLLSAAIRNHERVVKQLLASGADTSAKGWGKTPLDLAKELGHENVVMLLEAAARDPSG